MKVAFIVNGKARRLSKIHSAIVEFEQSQLAEKVSSVETEYPNHATELAEEYGLHHDIVIAVGGDGTANEVVNGLMKLNQVPIMGILPYGTANDLSRTIKVEADIQQLINLIDQQKWQEVDLGLVNLLTEDASSISRYFINVVDFGIGGYVVEKVAKSKKPFGARFTFLKTIFDSMITYEQSEVKIKSKEFDWQGKLLSMAVSNGQYFGSGIQVASGASMKDSWFDVCVFSEIGAATYLKHVNKIRKGHKINHSGVHYFKTQGLKIEPIDLSCAIDIDGEFCGFAPAEVSIRPKAIKLLMPTQTELDFC